MPCASSRRTSQPALPAGLLLGVMLLVAACGPGTAAPSTSAPSDAPPSASPGATLAGDAIAHPTGAGDVVLRAALEGGFIRMESVMGRLPLFTLYGDGRVLLLPDDPQAAPDATPRLRETRLSEDEVQRLLRYALAEGGLGIARDAYTPNVMDAPSTVFEVHTDDVSRRVVVGALTPDPEPGPDAAAYRAFADLLARLRSLPTSGDYVADRHVAILAETEVPPGGAPATPWPWADLEPADFAPPEKADPFAFAMRVLTPGQLEAAGVAPDAGETILNVSTPDGRTWVVVVRPALPDEIAAAAS